jgi:cation diffusion facilitator CzcD-associated flavoprotein CzcO
MHRASVVILGAGPYGVSIAAHLQSTRTDFRIFGKPLYRWRAQMPKGMFLKSEGRASSLSDPDGIHTLARYCAEHGLPYAETGIPVPLEDFSEYAMSFQRSLAPMVEDLRVMDVARSGDSFDLRLSDGSMAHAGRVIVATGLEHTAHIPPALAALPSELVSHSGDHHDLGRFSRKKVTVLGAGQSALETAVLLAEQRASVRLLVRSTRLLWNAKPNVGRRSLYQRLRYPDSNLGQGLQIWSYCTAPAMFRYLPEQTRLGRLKTVLGPAGAWWLKERLGQQVQILLGHVVERAETRGDRALLHVAGPDGAVLNLETDHVIAATGYRFDLRALPFLDSRLKARIAMAGPYPVLSPNFESSVPGLYFTGLASANSFGPAMRFLHGAHYTARRLARHISAGRSLSVGPSRSILFSR